MARAETPRVLVLLKHRHIIRWAVEPYDSWWYGNDNADNMKRWASCLANPVVTDIITDEEFRLNTVVKQYPDQYRKGSFVTQYPLWRSALLKKYEFIDDKNRARLSFKLHQVHWVEGMSEIQLKYNDRTPGRVDFHYNDIVVSWKCMGAQGCLRFSHNQIDEAVECLKEVKKLLLPAHKQHTKLSGKILKLNKEIWRKYEDAGM